MKTYLNILLSLALFTAGFAVWLPANGRAAFTTGNLAVFSADSATGNNTTFTILELSSTTAGQSSPVNSIAINGTTGGTALRTSGSAASTGYLADSDDGKLLVFSAHNTTTSSGNINTFTARGVGTLNNAGTFVLQATYTGASGNQTRGACTANNSLWLIGDQGGIYTNSATSTPRPGNFRSVKSFGGALYAFTASASYPPVLTLSTSPIATNGLAGLPNGDSNMQDFCLLSSGSNGSTFDLLYLLDASSATAGTIYKYSLVSGVWTANGSYATVFGGFGICAAKSGSGAALYVTTGTGATAANSVIKLFDAAGFNAAIAITTANNATLYTAAAGTTMKGIAFAPACTAPTAAVRSADSTAICFGASASLHADLSGTAPWTVIWSDGVTQNNVASSPATRSVSPGATTIYTVTAVSDSTACSPGVFSGSATITVNPIPSSMITAASSVCPGSTGNTASVPDAGTAASYGWTITGGSITAGSATNLITYTAGASGAVVLGCTVTNSSGCYSNASAATVAISAAVTTTAGNSGPGCVGGMILLTAAGDAGDTYSWSGPNGFISSAQNPVIANATFANVGDYTVTRTTACGISAPATTTVAVNPTPAATITASSSVCGNSTGNAASVPDAGTGASYGWTISGGSIKAGAGTASINYTANASGSVVLGCAVTNSSGCSANAGSVTVTINPLPDSAITSASSTYLGSTNNTASVADAGPGANYAWTISGGSITSGGGTRGITFTASAAGTLTLGCTVTTSAGCSSGGSANVIVHPAFTTRNLAVVRIGGGATALSSAGTPEFVDEYTVSGVLVQSLALPTNGSSAFVNSGSASSEGGLTRSPDGSVICLAGYNASAATPAIASTAAAAVPRVAATLNAGGTFALAAATSTQFDANNIRCAATDGTNNFWAAGGSSGTYYLGTASAATVQSTLANTRELSLCNGSLYFSVGSGSARGIYGFSGLPMTAAAATQMIDTGSSSSPYAFAINAAGTVAYLADDSSIASAGGIQKWTNNAGAWSLAYTLTNAGTGARGLAVDFSGANPVIFGTTTESSTNRLIAFTDTGSDAAVTTLAIAASNTIFRGVAFTPQSAPAITTQPQNQSACSGSAATFTSAADGAGTLASQWQVSPDGGTNFSDIAGATTANYSLVTSAGDSGKQFRVVYRNSYGTVSSAVATLAVHFATAGNFSLDAYQGASFKIADSNVLAHAAGSGGVTLAGLDALSANGVNLAHSNSMVFYQGNLTVGDSFHYTAAAVSGGCTATALVTIVVNTNLSPAMISLAGGTPVLNFLVLPNYSYTVQRSTNLTAWDDLLTTNASGPFIYQDPAVSPSAAFYRLRYNP